ncbi:hypothetical protein SAMN05216489_05966 [Streptomyces sp. 3213]|uniref:hypothetical protein n=1 Tax=Streptomyces sp. 3213.3 TaxID=1855348 RepID=UPI00089B95F6|nr:hypothetical protein [Streptomyces sp. 3213.3]SEE24467.1 hypothetical protein SAMN05216489_05966 [Streptomyces sp. 3213] [Streptomyces sp. 3213.3]
MPENPRYEYEFTPQERDDVNRFGGLFETLQNDLYLGLVVDEFVMVLGEIFAAEFAVRAAGSYPPPGHGYPRLGED